MLTAAASLCAALSAFFGVFALLEILARMEFDRRAEEKKLPLLLSLAMPLTPNMLPLVRRPAFAGARQAAREQIVMAGYDQILDAERLLAARLILAAGGLAALAVLLAEGQPLLGALLFAFMAAWPSLWIRRMIRQRHEQIQRALPNVLDLLTLSVEAGKDFVTALRDILAQRRRDALAEELEIAFREIQLGKQRRVALKDMAARAKQHDLTAVVNAIAQADELGVSIGHLLRIQGDQMRMKRFQRAEKLANEAPVKILVPVVLFIFPSVFIILMGPVLFQAYKMMLK